MLGTGLLGVGEFNARHARSDLRTTRNLSQIEGAIVTRVVTLVHLQHILGSEAIGSVGSVSIGEKTTGCT